jgi:hypothetical protein
MTCVDVLFHLAELLLLIEMPVPTQQSIRA